MNGNPPTKLISSSWALILVNSKRAHHIDCTVVMPFKSSSCIFCTTRLNSNKGVKRTFHFYGLYYGHYYDIPLNSIMFKIYF